MAKRKKRLTKKLRKRTPKKVFNIGGVIVTFKKLKNKSRKGDYAYVRKAKGRGKYFKVDKEVGKSPKPYALMYAQGGIKGRKGVTKKGYTETRKALKRVEKYPSIEESLGNGVSGTTIEQAYNITPYNVKRAYMNLLRNTDRKGDGGPIVKDQQLINILTMPENIEKWKMRVLVEIDLMNTNGDVITSISSTGIKTLMDIQKEIIGKVTIGAEFHKFSKGLNASMISNGYKQKSGGTHSGRLSNVRIKMAFRKASG